MSCLPLLRCSFLASISLLETKLIRSAILNFDRYVVYVNIRYVSQCLYLLSMPAKRPKGSLACSGAYGEDQLSVICHVWPWIRQSSPPLSNRDSWAGISGSIIKVQRSGVPSQGPPPTHLILFSLAHVIY